MRPPNKYAALIALGGVFVMVWRMAFKFSKRDNDPDREWRERFDQFDDMLTFVVLELHTMITPAIQDALDRIRQTQSLAHASVEALKLQSTQIGTLNDKITELQAKIDAGGTISAEDLAAVAEISSDIDSTNAELQSAVPANTKPQPAPPPAPTQGTGQPAVDPTAPADPNNPPPAPDLSNDTQHAADAEAASQAKPL